MTRQPLLLQFVILLAVVTLFMGCGRARYDARLVQADSLMWTAPDSALATLAAIDSLAGEANQAYRDLLTTQARYRTYQDITTHDDSAITRAMDYYSAHSGQREKLTRACLYKGAVMEELGHVDSAMYYYKTAEVTADTTDYLNLGQINIRIARLFRDYYSDSQICFDKYLQALKYFRLTDNKSQQLICLVNMGGCSGITRTGNPEELLTQASQLAIELNDTSNYCRAQELLCRQLSFEGKDLNTAKQIALTCLKDFSPFVCQDLLLDLAEIYVKCGILDSARYYLSYVDQDANVSNPEQIKTRKYSILSRIAQLDGNESLSGHYTMLSHQLSDSILNSELRYQIRQIESSFNNQQRTGFLSRISLLNWIILGLSVSALLTLTLIIAGHLRRMRRTKAIIRELQTTSTARLEQLIGLLDNKSSAIEHMLTSFVTFIKSISVNGTQITAPQVAKQIKETFTAVADDSFWRELGSYVDKKYNGMILKNAQTHNLTEKDLHFIELCLCGFSNAEIAIILDYSLKYISNKRKTLSEKLGTDLHFKSI